MKKSFVPKGFRTLFGGKPFSSNPTGKTREEFLADIRLRKPKRCDVLSSDDLLGIDLRDQFLINPCRSAFKGRFREDDAGLTVDGKFEYRLSYKVVVLLFLLLPMILALKSGDVIVGFLSPIMTLPFVILFLWIMQRMDDDREKIIKGLLNGGSGS